MTTENEYLKMFRPKGCKCEHPIFSNKETIDKSIIKCEVCKKTKTKKREVGFY